MLSLQKIASSGCTSAIEIHFIALMDIDLGRDSAMLKTSLALLSLLPRFGLHRPCTIFLKLQDGKVSIMRWIWMIFLISNE